MQRINRSLIVAAMALASVAMASQGGVVLRRTLVENSTDTYKAEIKLKQNVTLPTGDQDMALTEKESYVVKTGKVDPATKTAELTVTRTVDSVDGDPGPALEMAKSNIPKPFSTSGKLNEMGHVVFDLSKLTATQAMAVGQSGSGNQFIQEFPEKAVKIGDTWDVPIPKSLITSPVDQKLTATLTGEKKVGDKDCWVITTAGTLNIDIDTEKLPEDPDATGPMGNPKMHITGPATITMEILVDKSNGKTIKVDAKSKSTSKIELAAAGLTIDATSVATSTITLQN